MMNNNEMIERYVYAVTRLLPKKNREEVGKEIEGNIYEMLEARCGEITPTEQDIRVVLAELGTPAELAQKYDTDTVGHLIGGTYYFKYKIVLKIVLIATIIGATLAFLLGMIFDRDQSIFEYVTEWLFSAVPGMFFSAFAVITFVFAILERKNVRIDDKLDNLPSVPEKAEKIKIGDCIVDICFAVFFTVLILFFGDKAPIIASIGDEGMDIRTIPLFNIEAVQAVWIPLVIWTLMTVTRNVIRIVEGRKNMTVFVSGLITSAVSVVCAYIFLVGSGVFNMEGLRQAAAMTGDAQAQEVLTKFFGHIDIVLFVCITFGHVMEIITNLVYAVKGRK